MLNIYLSILLIFISPALFAASFDCDTHKILTPIEKMICADPQLNDADEKMSKGYFTLLRDLLDLNTKKLFIQEQREWLIKRNFELATCSKPNCEIQFYNLRLHLLYPNADINCMIPKAETNSEIADKLEAIIELIDISFKPMAIYYKIPKVKFDPNDDAENKKINFKLVNTDYNIPKVSFKSATEIICADRLLRHVDGKVVELYTPLQQELSKDQAAWLLLRDEKLKNCDLMCLWKFYKERIEFLIHYSFDESYIDILEK